MEFLKIQPFVRYVHYLPISKHSLYNVSIPYDNRLFFLFHGSLVIEASETVYNMNEGDVIIIPAGVQYHIMPQNQKASIIGVNFDYTQNNLDKTNPIPPTDVNMYNPEMNIETVDFSDTKALNGVLHLKGLSSLYVKFVRLEQEYSHKLIYFEHIISNILAEILIECVRASDMQKAIGSRDTIADIIAYINENYKHELTNSEIGKVFNLHPNYINKLIKIFTGMSLHQYLMQIRISHSAEMLETKTHTIGEIAEKCGFCDIYHYSKTFKKIMGISPSKYV